MIYLSDHAFLQRHSAGDAEIIDSERSPATIVADKPKTTSAR